MTDNLTIYARMAKARETDKHTNGFVIKPFKSTIGEKELFINKERVSVTKSSIRLDTEAYFFTVTGVAYDVKKNSFNMKAVIFDSEDKLLRYVNMTADYLIQELAKPKLFKSIYETKSELKSINNVIIPKGTKITKFKTIQGGGILNENIEIEGYDNVIITNEQIAMFCNTIEPSIEMDSN